MRLGSGETPRGKNPYEAAPGERMRLLALPALVVALLAALSGGAGLAGAGGTPVADLAGTLDGPTSGGVGDNVTFTVTVTNIGPDAVQYLPVVLQWYPAPLGTSGNGLDYVSNDSPPNQCMYEPPNFKPPTVECPATVVNPDNTVGWWQPGDTFTVHVQLKVAATIPMTVCGGANSAGLTTQPDPNDANNVRCLTFNPSGPPSPPGPLPPPAPPAAPTATFDFIDPLPRAYQYRGYSGQVVRCADSDPFCRVTTSLVGGTLPPGLKLNSIGQIYGSLYTAGTFTFTVEGNEDFGSQGVVTLRHDYTFVVAPYRSTSSGSTSSVKLVLPKRSLTPGLINPVVRQATIRKTICVAGWTAKMQPPASFTDALKVKQMKQYGETGSARAYEEDHLIPLELGGASRSAKNLWPEPRAQSRHSDRLEIALKRKVCAGTLTLAAARKQIITYKRTNG